MTHNQLRRMSLENRRAALGVMSIEECAEAGYCECGKPLEGHPELPGKRRGPTRDIDQRPTNATTSPWHTCKPVDDGTGTCANCGRGITRIGNSWRHTRRGIPVLPVAAAS